MRNFLKPAVLLALAATLFTGAEAQNLRRYGNLNLNYNQKTQIRQILNSGNRRDPATRQRMQQQIMNVLTPQQQNQLAYEIQQRNGNQNYNYQYNPSYNNGYYYNNNRPYNNGYYNNGYYYNSGNTMQNLINSGILNGVLQTLINQ
ncbi:MAG: hypothetical protein KF760_15500 [Candidatus Eremiobacteraeota bacterium]|nr:hypothetical protein [Candidatus Eremiobacteraeota bacterium]MCW5869317.1 hypothetical protein [Candidatus Eremiobacteraeota bacterium]